MNKQQIKELALASGFKLKLQQDGAEDLNPYVYEFASMLMKSAINEAMDKIGAEFSVPKTIGKATQKAELYKAGFRHAFVLAKRHAIHIGEGKL